MDEEVSPRRINAAAKILSGNPDDAMRILEKLGSDDLSNLGEVVHQIQRKRAIAEGDPDSIIESAFEDGFGPDGMGHPPWIEGSVIVCPGSIINKSKSSHRCRFISVNDTWVWDSPEVMREDKRSIPGTNDGFRAIALVPVLNGLTLDVVTGRARSGQHQVDNVVSYKVKRNKLEEVAQRNVKAMGMK